MSPLTFPGGIQALEAMLYTLDYINDHVEDLIPDIQLGALVLDDCDNDSYGLTQAVDFIKGQSAAHLKSSLVCKASSGSKETCRNEWVS